MQLDQLEMLSCMHQPVNVSSNICSQRYVQIKHSLVHWLVEDTYTIIPAKVEIKSFRYTRECFIVHTFGYMCL